MKTVCVAAADGEIEAQHIRALLEANGIPCEFRGEALRKTHGFTLNGLGRVEILVPASKADEARVLMARVEAGDLRLPE